MNFKKLLSLATVVASGAALAVVSSGNAVCRIQVNSDTKETVLSIPLVAINGSAETINVTNFVLTTGLKSGSTLSYKDSEGAWRNWALESDGGPWTAASGTTAPTSDTFPRGSAVLLTRAGSASDLATPIYLYGQFCSTDKVSTPISGTTVAPAYTPMGNAKPEAFALNKANFWTTSGSPTTGDQLIVPVTVTIGESTIASTKTYTWNGSAWTQPVRGGTPKATNDSIPAGQGFWYKSVGTTVPTVTW